MNVEFDKKELPKYPFLKEAHNLVSDKSYSLDTILSGNYGKRIAENAVTRIKKAIDNDYSFDTTGTTLDFPEYEILTYAMARLIVSCLNERMVIDKLCRYESERAAYYLSREDPLKKEYIAGSLGILLNSDKIKVSSYVELVISLRDPKWQLVNRDVSEGFVAIKRLELEELLKERIRTILSSQLPMPVSDGIKKIFKAWSDEISIVYKQKVIEQFGEVDEGSFPPCMKAIIGAVANGTNIPHTARFSLTAFMHTIGMNGTEIVGVFMRAPDFNVDMTTYQVEHISGRSGVEYTPPMCVTMKTYGLCPADSLCKSKGFVHPLSYYKYKKAAAKKNGGKNAFVKSDAPKSGEARSVDVKMDGKKKVDIGARIDAANASEKKIK